MTGSGLEGFEANSKEEMWDRFFTTQAVEANSKGKDPRLTFIISRLIPHLHDFAREVRLTFEEWQFGLKFLVEVGKTCTDVRHEFILLSDVLGLSVLVDAMSHVKAKNATPGTLLGPFHTEDANVFDQGECIVSKENEGDPLTLYGTVRDIHGNPIPNVSIDIWETDETGHYDTQYDDRNGPDYRGIIYTDEEGKYLIKGIVPVSYPIPHDGPVGRFLTYVGRHPYRPAHIHFKLEKEGYDNLITGLYMKGDKYIGEDAVFGEKKELTVEPKKFGDQKLAEKYMSNADDYFINFDITLMSNEESMELFDAQSRRDLKTLGIDAKVVNGVPIADLD